MFITFRNIKSCKCNDLIIDYTRSSKNNYELMSEWIKLQRLMWNESDNNVINTIGLLKEFIRRSIRMIIYILNLFNKMIVVIL